MELGLVEGVNEVNLFKKARPPLSNLEPLNIINSIKRALSLLAD